MGQGRSFTEVTGTATTTSGQALAADPARLALSIQAIDGDLHVALGDPATTSHRLLAAGREWDASVNGICPTNAVHVRSVSGSVKYVVTYTQG